MDRAQLRKFIIRPALEGIGLWSVSAEHLLLGTAMVESELEYVMQKPAGPALSIFQIEPLTYRDLVTRLPNRFPDVYASTLSTLNMPSLPLDASYLIGNLTAATIVARLKYYFSPTKMPTPLDYEGMAVFWKNVYNTNLGDGNLVFATKIFRSVVYNYVEHSKY